APAAKPSSGGSGGGAKKIVITISQQRLRAYEGNRVVLDTVVSTGKPGHATPRGNFSILSKTERHWSTQYHVWMPYAMRVYKGIFIHEIPISPDGRRLGANQLGQPVSAGCVRVGIGPAASLYRWAPVGTPVIIQ
ncbi:MAG TPA: L,D-transpeptidase, partial [Actinomycetota bacterium]|nr:L,D-transpeptidase [Actinomycetota bacterium]